MYNIYTINDREQGRSGDIWLADSDLVAVRRYKSTLASYMERELLFDCSSTQLVCLGSYDDFALQITVDKRVVAEYTNYQLKEEILRLSTNQGDVK